MSAAAVRRIRSHEITTEDGASARIEQRHEGEVLAVRDRVGRLMFEYDATNGRGMLVMAEGDLRLCAPRGAIELFASQGIRVASPGEVSIASSTSIALDAAEPDNEKRASIRLEGGQADVESQTLKVQSSNTELSLGEAHAVASSLSAVVDRAELKFQEVTRTAGRVIEQAENVFQRVGELYELKAGRLRSLVKGALWLKGEDVTMLAKNDVRIDGEHINLG